MSWSLHAGLDAFVIESRFEPARAGHALDFFDSLSARGFLNRFLLDPHNLTTLREVVAEEHLGAVPFNLEDSEVLDLLAQSLTSRRFRVVLLRQAAMETYGEGEPESVPPPIGAVTESSWILLKVVDDATDEPIPKVKLTLTLPDGSKADHTTNAEGAIDLDPVRPGTCQVVTDMASPKRAETLVLVRLTGPTPPPPEDPKKKRKKPKQAPYKVGRIERHRVRTGDTLAGLAQMAGMTWKELAKFNWGTDDPKKVNRHLRWDVGCTKKTADGSNYVFDDSDSPGIVLLPFPWSAPLGTGLEHVLRVSPVDPAPWRFST